MAFHSFLSSHRLHWGASHSGANPLPVQLDRILHEMSVQLHRVAAHGDPESGEPAGLMGATALPHIGFEDVPGP